MFSGIVETKVRATKIIRQKNNMVAMLATPKNWRLNIGESINIDGICSTVFAKTKRSFSVYWMDETLQKTNLLKLKFNHFFNLERSLRLNSLLGGHVVSGHVDTVGEVSKIIKKEDSTILKIKLSKEFLKYIIYKGSIAVNGVSLTIIACSKDSFSVSLIPYTLKVTNLGDLNEKDKVNIEVDLIAKYLEKLVKT